MTTIVIWWRQKLCQNHRSMEMLNRWWSFIFHRRSTFNIFVSNPSKFNIAFCGCIVAIAFAVVDAFIFYIILFFCYCFVFWLDFLDVSCNFAGVIYFTFFRFYSVIPVRFFSVHALPLLLLLYRNESLFHRFWWWYSHCLLPIAWFFFLLFRNGVWVHWACLTAIVLHIEIRSETARSKELIRWACFWPNQQKSHNVKCCCLNLNSIVNLIFENRIIADWWGKEKNLREKNVLKCTL